METTLKSPPNTPKTPPEAPPEKPEISQRIPVLEPGTYAQKLMVVKIFFGRFLEHVDRYAKKLIVVNFFIFFWNFEISFFHFFLEILSPERFKQLREACRIHFHLVAPLKTVMVPSYDRKTKKIND